MNNLSNEQISGELKNRFERSAEIPQISEPVDEGMIIRKCINPNPVYCMTCALSHGEPPFADMPEKAYCVAYPEKKGFTKPSDVLFDGAPCAFYEEEKGT